MKKSFHLTLFIIVIILFSCERPVVFTETQPQGFSPQDHFSIFYRGSFFSDSDNSLVIVSKHMVCKKKEYSFVLPKSAIDTMSDVRFVDDQLYIKAMEKWIPTTTVGDSIYAQVTKRDTLFEIGKDQVLTEFRGHEILNLRGSDDNWDVGILSLDEDMNITLSVADVPEDIARLKEITPVKDLSREDTIQYLISPTVYEFNQILEEELIFKPMEYYTRVVSLLEI